ncbi:MAG TPA: NADH-quinone oxidoreductase subunit M, partial [Pyrinomonadaceae bacterium]|nr:NADH-quinone oxidoreductase subunit M [Pyrinomonadaceae bacterium]
MERYLITTLILLPAIGALAVVALGYISPRKAETQYRWLALGVSTATFLLSLLLLKGDSAAAGFRFVQDVSWIGALNARYHVGVDGISLWLVLLTTLLVPVSILSSWHAIHERRLAFYMFLLLLEGAMIGVFVSLDLLLFYLFFEASLVPMYFLIGVWGGERRIYAAIKFFIFTAVGSLLMLVGIIALYYHFGTFDYTVMLAALQSGAAAALPERWEFWLFLAFAFAFSIKVPLFPFHTWLPDAHTEAPTAG